MKCTINKYLYGWKIYLDYGQGWEYECFELTFKDMKETKRLYRENAPEYPIKAVQGREINPLWENNKNKILTVI
jgi:hypothetical protein